ncbi:diguanylate cyclase [Alkalilimnicola ehrlichii]|uniref:diguanylate cyclase n=1 Tax=Alkalilimnicola ehrlichii TaxID=351052 RepID=UPI0015F28940|nr:diguanylate cyclase [Alkalilimnicola ehrlichii]
MKHEVSADEAALASGLADYIVLERVFDGERTRVYRGRAIADGKPVIVKALRDERQEREAIARFYHEYEVLTRLGSDYIVRPYSLEQVNNLPVLILEDIGGESLDRILATRPLSVEECLQIGSKVAAGLAELHAAQLVHKDITPSNLIYNPESGRLQLIDFGLAISFTCESPLFVNPSNVPGTVAYMSPEQTGRMNRTLDYRTDLYSLGATLYALLTRRPLFPVTEPLEWFHCHIAKDPVPPAAVDPAIPASVSAVIMKLLAKTAEERYQSAKGVQADLQRCLKQLRYGKDAPSFTPGLHDVPDKFRIPERLYGREGAVVDLLTAFEAAGRHGVAVAMLAGRLGVGKTRLLHELYKPVTARKGYFVTGKFDPVHRDVPYSALTEALSDLVRQLLTESAGRLADWREKIMAGLGANAGLIVDLIPQLAFIVGPQPGIPDLPPLESEQRFRLALLSFIRVFDLPEHPLVLVLDDLQWADPGTLGLVDLLRTRAEGKHLLLLGAYRDDEVRPGHPLLEAIDQLEDSDTPLFRVTVEPLSTPALCQLLGHTLRAAPADVEPLAQLVKRKTEGNPFFVEEFLRSLHADGLIAFDLERGCWHWNLERINAQRMTDNVVDLMARKLEVLAEETRQVLEVAACAGGRFSLRELSIMLGEAPVGVAVKLQQAVAEGLIAPVKDGYQLLELRQAGRVSELTVAFAFTHDRIQQAAYELIDPAERAAVHLRVGRRLLHGLPEAKGGDEFFSIVNHLNIGEPLLTDPEERVELCRLNLLAAKRAKQTASYRIAFGHLERALALAGVECWENDYALALELYVQASETAYLSGQYEALDDLLKVGLQRAGSVLDQAAFYEVQISAYIARGELLRAIQVAKPVLKRLGHSYPANPNKFHVLLALLKIKRRLRGGFDELRALPPMMNPRHLAAMRIGGTLGSAAMFAQPMLLPLMVLSAIEVSIEHGQAPLTATSFVMLGMIFANALGDIEQGDALGRLGLEMAEASGDLYILGRAQHLYGSLVQHWKTPLYKTFGRLREAAKLCLENGDFEYAIHATTLHCKHMQLSGAGLSQVEQELSRGMAAFKALRQRALLYHVQGQHQTVLNLLGRSADPAHLVGEAYDIDVLLPLHRDAKDRTLVESILLHALFLRYTFGDYEGALALADQSDEDVTESSGFYAYLLFEFYDPLIRLRVAETAPKARRRRLIRQASRRLKKLKRYAARCPVNFLDKQYLVEAERLRVMGKPLVAHEYYDLAIACAREQGFMHEQALANELCGDMHMAAGRLTLGLPYLRESHALYRRWGAVAKVRQLEQRFPQLRSAPSATATHTSAVPLASIDIGGLMKALKAIADEQVHGRMVMKVITSAMEFAGAQRGALALRGPQGDLYIEVGAEVGTEPRVHQQQLLSDCPLVSQAVVNYVTRTRQAVVVDDAQGNDHEIPGLNLDEHVIGNRVRSILCLPIIAGAGVKSELIGLLYLENNRTTNCFTPDRFGILEIIGVAAAGRLELSRKAALDGLTNLYNHDYFQNTLKQEVVTASRFRRKLSLILIDIDHFKSFNDQWGHPLGDRVLREVAELIKLNSREGDTVARYGGEEIAVILPGLGQDEARLVAERFRHAVETHQVEHDRQCLSVTVSLGVASLGEQAADAAGLIRKADEALYRSKAQGRNYVSVA